MLSLLLCAALKRGHLVRASINTTNGITQVKTTDTIFKLSLLKTLISQSAFAAEKPVKLKK